MNLEKQINNQSSKIEKREKSIFSFKELRKKGYSTIVAASIFLHGCAAIPVKKLFVEAMPHSEKEKIFSEYGIGNLEELEKIGPVKVLITGDKYLVVLKQAHHAVADGDYAKLTELIIKSQDQIEKIMNALNTDTFIAEGLLQESNVTPEIIRNRADEISNLIKEYKEQNNNKVVSLESAEKIIKRILDIINIINQGAKEGNNPEYHIAYQNMFLITTLLSTEDISFLFETMNLLHDKNNNDESVFFIDFFHLLIRKNYLNEKNIENSNYNGAYFNKWLNNQVRLLSAEKVQTFINMSRENVKINEMYELMFTSREDEVLNITHNYLSSSSQSKFIPVVFGADHNFADNVNKFNQNNNYDYKLGLIECEPTASTEAKKYIQKLIKKNEQNRN